MVAMFVILVLMVLAYGWIEYVAIPYEVPVPGGDEILTSSTLANVGWVILACFLLFVLYKIATSGIAVPVFAILIGVAAIGAVSYLYYYGDKDMDGVKDGQILKVVQPVGNDPEFDAAYADINQENARTNLWSTASIVSYIGIFLVALVVLAGIGVVLGII